MSKYPDVISSDYLATMAHVTDAEIERDIADTEAEILTEQRRADAQREVARNTGMGLPEYKMAHFRADAYQAGVQERIAFVAFLRKLQEARKQIRETVGA
jgi:regulator of protease activity HflC (stomatin/prohibitin superfamily)